jgi:hydroxyethylthiazole kinase-like uncharacterized protein yjeF
MTAVTSRLPSELYTAVQVREMDRVAIGEVGIPGADLMERAGRAALSALRVRWPSARRIAVACGPGNNGGDGFVLARVAREAGLAADAFLVGQAEGLKGDARAAAEAWRGAGGAVRSLEPDSLSGAEVVVDALLGTGLDRDLVGPMEAAVRHINGLAAPVLAIDLPSGLHADTGRVLGAAVRADVTVTFIALKQGLFTGEGPALCGVVLFSDLGVPAETYSRFPAAAERWEPTALRAFLGPRARTAHKGHFGHVLVVGGDQGMPGAARMAAQAAARVGAGLVTIATHPEHAAFLNLGRPELMCHAVRRREDLDPLLARATVVALGPGLGRGRWGQGLFERVLGVEQPLVVDADALNLLAAAPCAASRWVLTPHPGEAGRLLESSAEDVQADRFSAARALQSRYGGVCVLKGAGTLVAAQDGPVSVIAAGNPGMASGGMGDVLTGAVAGFLAQGLSFEDAARLGAWAHAVAGDRAARAGERGMLAGDVLEALRLVVNHPRPPLGR